MQSGWPGGAAGVFLAVGVCACDVLSPLASTPLLPSTRVTLPTELVRTSCAPGTCAATALAAAWPPPGYSTVVAAVGSVESTTSTWKPAALSASLLRAASRAVAVPLRMSRVTLDGADGAAPARAGSAGLPCRRLMNPG